MQRCSTSQYSNNLDSNYSIVAERLLLFKVDEVQNNTIHYTKNIKIEYNYIKYMHFLYYYFLKNLESTCAWL
jgi:hypothetical protein